MVYLSNFKADGTVLSRCYGTDKWVTVDMGFTSYTYLTFEQSLRRDYVGVLSLEDGGIEKFRHEAGWTDSKGREVAAVYDHRGSLRATWTKPRNTNSGLIPGGSISLLPSKVFDNLTAYYPYGLPFADWQGDDRYLYCGKELEREFGMLTYDYHARGYNPALALFDRPDPCATKFPHVFSYLYCNANPISYTDPTGCEVYNNEYSEFYKSIANKLQQYQTENLELANTIRKTNESYSVMEEDKLTLYVFLPASQNINKDIPETKFVTNDYGMRIKTQKYQDIVNIYFKDHDAGNAIHEGTHGGQIARKEFFYDESVGSEGKIKGLTNFTINQEVDAYKAQFSVYRFLQVERAIPIPNTFPQEYAFPDPYVSSIDAITPEFVRSIIERDDKNNIKFIYQNL